ncbi:MAG: hypothetical protein DRQ97_02885 [Gammaproteobacteria bacterium]|nr:MAG: hypothetical protein DRQ97_02885 [Gammaproteobacteria bacterium]
MDIGLLFCFRNPDFNRVPWAEFYESEMELAVSAEGLSYDHVWLSEHHFVDDGYAPSLLPIAAAIAARTTTIRIGTYVLLLPLHNPVRVAEDVATVDIISNGRFDLGLGLGYRPGEFTGMGIPTQERGPRFQEALPLVQQLLSGEKVTLDGRFTQVHDIEIIPPPIQRNFPIWVGARNDKQLDRAARLGCHMASIGAPGHAEKYVEALNRHGRKEEDHSIALLLTCYVADSNEQAWKDCAQPLHHVVSEYQAWAEESGDQTGDGAATMAVPSPKEIEEDQACSIFGRAAVIGDTETVIEGLRKCYEETRITHFVLIMALPGAHPDQTRKSMELFSEYVMPEVRKFAN